MKEKLLHFMLLVATTVVVVSLWSCSDSDEDEPYWPDDEEKSIKSSDLQYQILSEDDRTVAVILPPYHVHQDEYGNTVLGYYSGDIVVPATITLEGKTYTVTEIGKEAFVTHYYISREYPSYVKEKPLKSVTLPNTITSIGDKAFSMCSSLVTVNIPNSVTSIGESVFSGCASLTSMDIPNSVTSIGESVFSGCTSLTSIDIPNSVTSIGESVFSGCTSLTSMDIPNSVTSIGKAAFSGCTSLSSITIGTGVLEIGYKAFEGCTNLYKILMLPNTPPNGINYAFETLADRVCYVANDEYFYGVLGKRIIYPFLSSYFDAGGLRYVPVSPSERTCAIIDCLYNAKNVTIANTVTYDGVSLDVTEINPNIFVNNESLTSLNYNVALNIPDNFAYGCSNLSSLKLADGIETIGENAFRGCVSLTNVQLPSSVTSIDKAAFYNSGIMAITIPSATTSIGNSAFTQCPNLATFVIVDGEETLQIGYNNLGGEMPMFAGTGLKDVIIGRRLKYQTSSSYGYSPFYRNTSLQTVSITDVPEAVFINEFYGCTALKNVSIGDGVTKIGDYAFSGCSSIESFSFGASVTSIGKEAFSDCTAMTKLYAEPCVPPTCASQALDDINKWDCTLYVPGNAVSEYQAASQWKEFFKVEAYTY